MIAAPAVSATCPSAPASGPTAAGATSAVLAWCVFLWGPRTTASAFLKSYARWFLPESARPGLRPAEEELLRRKVRLGPFFALGTALTLLVPWHPF